MTLLTRKVRMLLGFLTLAVTMYNCQPKEVASVTPFTYTFKGLEEVKLPAYQPTAPAAVTVTPAQVTSSTATAALTSIISTSATPTAVQSATQTAAQVTAVIPEKQVDAIAAAYKPTDVVNAAKSGNVPADLKALVTSFSNNPNLKKYLATFTPPTINGKPVGARIGVVQEVAIVLGTTDDIDACKNTANEAYNTVLASITKARDDQRNAVNATYTAAETSINSQSTSCPTDVETRYNTLRNQTTDNYNTVITALVNFTNQLPAAEREDVYNGLYVIYTVSYLSSMEASRSAEGAEKAACSQSKDARINAAKAARDSDLAEVTTNFNNAVKAAENARNSAIASCHNQGSGK
ncbi:hypothetical protein [Tellurirhabdus rosea]|uniref:hypothetical protein n=1 Tax=Tellurirhabdus rosea TaxID=2674997 RepID=UPI00225558DE|nr:hypothetical protein [Tellurirhabdus rosea]